MRTSWRFRSRRSRSKSRSSGSRTRSRSCHSCASSCSPSYQTICRNSIRYSRFRAFDELGQSWAFEGRGHVSYFHRSCSIFRRDRTHSPHNGIACHCGYCARDLFSCPKYGTRKSPCLGSLLHESTLNWFILIDRDSFVSGDAHARKS